MKSLARILFALVMLGIVIPAEAKEFTQSHIVKAMEKASARWRIPYPLVRAVTEVESGLHPWAVNVGGKSYYPQELQDALNIARAGLTSGKSVDIGLMQINKFWLQKFGLPLEAAFEPEINLILGSWILAHELKRHGTNWRGIGSYHTPVKRNPERARQYAAQVYEKMERR